MFWRAALGRNFSLSADASGAENVVEGPLGGGGIDLKFKFLSLKQIDISADGYGRGFYQSSSNGTAYHLYGGGAILLATLKGGFFSLSAGGGASYDFYGDSSGSAVGALGPIGVANIAYTLNQSTDLGLAFEYGADRFFLGAFVDFAISQTGASKTSAAPKKPAATTKKK